MTTWVHYHACMRMKKSMCIGEEHHMGGDIREGATYGRACGGGAS